MPDLPAHLTQLAADRGSLTTERRCSMRVRYFKGRPAEDYCGAHVLTPDQRLGTIVAIEYREVPAGYIARLRHFNGEPFPGPGYPMSSLEILEHDG